MSDDVPLSKAPADDGNALDDLERRLGVELLALRLYRQLHQTFLKVSRSGVTFLWEGIRLFPWLISTGLRLTGLAERARRNSIAYCVEEVDVGGAWVPPAFDGFSILHLSDLHLDGILDGGDRLVGMVSDISCDVCVMTGDFRYRLMGPYDVMLERMERLVRAVNAGEGIFAVLGNHDEIEMVPRLEALGVRVLLNESSVFHRGGARLWIAGVDDTHYFETYDLDAALAGVPDDGAVVLLAHSPEIVAQAESKSIRYYLCGHTHGGQICLPGRIPIISNTRSSRKYLSGPWRYRMLAGYTSRGVGASGVTARLFCPPEMTVHRLRHQP